MSEAAPILVTLSLVAAAFVAVPTGGAADTLGTPGSLTPCDDRSPHPPIRITEDQGPQGFILGHEPDGDPIYRPGSGVVDGNGTPEDPYLIAGWCIQERARHAPPVADEGILVEGTSAHALVQDNSIGPLPAVGFQEAIRLSEAENVTVDDNRITSNADGIYLWKSNATITNNTVAPVPIDGLDGLEIWMSDAVVTNNTVRQADTGVQVGLRSDVTLTGNTVNQSKEHGLYMADSTAVVADNTVTRSGYNGLAISDSTVAVTGNTVTLNGFSGVRLFGAEGHIANNTVAENTNWGIDVVDESNATVVDNVIEDNDGGILLNESEGTIHRNNLEANGVGLSVDGGEEPVDARGNWWGAASGPSGDVTDACTGEPADGSGEELEAVDGGDVCFDPPLTSPNPQAGAN